MQGNLGYSIGNQSGRASTLTDIITLILEKITWILEKILCESRVGLVARLWIFLWKFSYTEFCGIRARKYLQLYHTVIPLWIYRIPSELRSQAGLGLPSTVVGDHTGIVGAVCFFNIETIICDFETKNQGPRFWKKRTTVLPTYVLVVLFWGETVRILCL